MDTKELHAFLAVYEEQNIRAAAKRLFITPQGLSQIIKRLEQELETVLFERDNRGVTPTGYANALYHDAQTIIRKLDDIKSDIRRKGRDEKYSLSVMSSLGMLDYLTVRFLRAFREQFTDIALVFLENPCRTARQRLLDGEAELGFLVGPVDPLTFHALPFSEHHNCVVLHRDHPLARKERIEYADLAGQPLALEGRDIATYHNYHDRFLAAGVEPEIVIETTEIALTHRVASMNEGVGLSTDFAAWGNAYPDTVIRPFADMKCLEERFIVYPVERRLSGEARAFIDFSFDWLRRHKHELFHWPEPYGYLNDWYDL